MTYYGQKSNVWPGRLISSKNNTKTALLGRHKSASSHLGRNWRPNCWRHVNFWGTPEKFWVYRFKWALWKASGIKIETAAVWWITSPKRNRTSWNTAFCYKTGIPKNIQCDFFWEGSYPQNYYAPRVQNMCIKGVSQTFWLSVLFHMVPTNICYTLSKHCQMHNGPKGWVILTTILIKFHLQNLDQATTSKSRPNVSLSLKFKLHNPDQT